MNKLLDHTLSITLLLIISLFLYDSLFNNYHCEFALNCFCSFGLNFLRCLERTFFFGIPFAQLVSI